MKRMLLLSLLAALLGGCVVTPYGYRDRDDYYHRYGYRDRDDYYLSRRVSRSRPFLSRRRLFPELQLSRSRQLSGERVK